MYSELDKNDIFNFKENEVSILKEELNKCKSTKEIYKHKLKKKTNTLYTFGGLFIIFIALAVYFKMSLLDDGVVDHNELTVLIVMGVVFIINLFYFIFTSFIINGQASRQSKRTYDVEKHAKKNSGNFETRLELLN